MKKKLFSFIVAILTCITLLLPLFLSGCGENSDPSVEQGGDEESAEELFEGEFTEITEQRFFEIVEQIKNSETGDKIDFTKYGLQMIYNMDVVDDVNGYGQYGLNATIKAKKDNGKIVMNLSGEGNYGNINKLESYFYEGVLYHNVLKEKDVDVNKDFFDEKGNTSSGLFEAVNESINKLANDSYNEIIATITKALVYGRMQFEDIQEEIADSVVTEKIFECNEAENKKIKIEFNATYKDMHGSLIFIYVYDKDYNFMAQSQVQNTAGEGFLGSVTCVAQPYSGNVEIPDFAKTKINEYLN